MSSPKSIDRALDSLVAQFVGCFRDRLGPVRKVGREAEFPLVTADGRAGDVGALWEPLLSESGFVPQYNGPRTRDLMVAVQRDEVSIAIEVGRGTVELSLGPYDDLWQLQTAFDQAVALVARVAARRGLLLLGFGIQPRTPPSAALMTPRPRYAALYRAAGAPWLHLTTTAADQTHVDISRREMLDAVNWMNLLSGPMIALCANSSVYEGRGGRYLSGREGLLGELGEMRYGMTPRRFGDVAEFIRYLCDYRCFVLPDGDGFVQVNAPYTQVLEQNPETTFDQFLWHEHYVWNSARARVQNSTIEVRPACQQPPDESLAANALALGWVESLPQIESYFTDALGHDPWPRMLRYRRAVVRDGLAAQEPVPGMVRTLVEIAESGLARRGRREEKMLESVCKRVELRQSPGLRARQLFERSGMDALVAAYRIPGA